VRSFYQRCFSEDLPESAANVGELKMRQSQSAIGSRWSEQQAIGGDKILS